MNPWGIIIIGLSLVLIILGIKGSYAAAETTITGRQHQPLSNPGSQNQSGFQLPFNPLISLFPGGLAFQTPGRIKV